MGKGRAPCCDKNQVKRGPWSPAEDLRLINYVQKHGHDNWRALPKQAGLLRCGKSCRLRWINYLRPDLKRGNFTQEEEDLIIKLHQSWGNKWSKIASQLPGRTDNEIKNVWNTHLKKRLAIMDANPNANGSIKVSFSTSSSMSSNDIVSRSDTNMVTKYDCRQNQMAMAKNSPVMVNDSDVSSNVTNSNRVYVNINQGPNELRDGVEVNKPEGQEMPIELPLETDSEFWNLLGGLSNSPEPEECVPQSKNVEEIGNGYLEEIETKIWLRYLESELGLDEAPSGDQENVDHENSVETEVDSEIEYPILWP